MIENLLTDGTVGVPRGLVCDMCSDPMELPRQIYRRTATRHLAAIVRLCIASLSAAIHPSAR